MRRRLRPALVLLGALVASGCGDDGPTAPVWTGPNTVRIQDALGRLDAHRDLILELVDASIDTVGTVRAVSAVHITVFADALRAIPGYGIGGRTVNATTVELYVDPGYADLADVLAERLPPMLAHELHHVFRMRGPGYGSTLLQAMVSEGLADRFSMELLGIATPPWSEALTPGEFDAMLALARPEFDAPSYDHARWFFGTTAEVPNWTGYTLGYRFVTDYQAAHGGARAIDLVDTPAAAFRPE